MASWREGTSKQYHTYLKRWRQYCDDKDIDVFQPGVYNGVEFLVSLYKAGLNNIKLTNLLYANWQAEKIIFIHTPF